MREMTKIELRGLETRDLNAIERIEQRSYPTPWSRSMFAGELAKPSSICLGAFDAQNLAGYLIISRYVDAWHVMNVAVAPEYRRRGIAATMLARLFEVTAGDGTRWRNLGVKHLLALSFVDTRRGYALERDGILLRTSDAGATWPLVAGAPTAQALCFADPAHGWLARGGTIFAKSRSGWRPTRLRPTQQGLPVPALGCRRSAVRGGFHDAAGAG